LSFVMIAASGRQGSRVRTWSARRLATVAVLAALMLLALGSAFGYWLAVAVAPPPAPDLTRAEGRPHHFALEQIGALSARLFRLESQASQLGHRIGLLPGAAASAPEAVRPVPVRRTLAGSGGPLLPPRLDVLGTQLEQIEQHIELMADAVALRHTDLMRLPSQRPVAGGEQVSAFGNRLDPFTTGQAFHAGLDFAAVPGEPILAAAGGLVDVAGFRPDFGWMVEIDHGNGLRTRYAHASRLLVRRGEVVTPGERIALVGSSGRSTGPHLHFEVLRHGVPVNPRLYLAQR
jgi:murein DD-endopeptidase MepM/ murein hydrolase activator NlpD